ncbi:hypothetical protein SAMN05444372_104169 [Flavobacterium micromati]|jgi:hypothetical protein|uniref:CAAX prenyl protease 2/Lysostaphin resistance protein A-like domain-containing protein n=1 Tax=Flavobacterium micromati TaxID=229205 RepID=A0A1M5IN74_9FLAO|nr:CPBP family intramembrane glutamic endopeptidase [Flavobacterium micromati]SHG29727.1 hypothetical protein SAMN05444372_104169 [Flavobacterium micromati]
MFIEQGVKLGNKFAMYIWGSVLIIFASFLGQIPFIVALKFDVAKNGTAYPNDEASIMRYFDSNITLFLILISFVFVIISLIFVMRYLHNQSMHSITTSRDKVDWGRILFSFAVWSALTVGTTLISYYDNPANFVFNFKPIPFAILVVIGVILIPIQTSAEEYVFRGYLMQGFANLIKNKWFPLLMTSLIFGGMHFFNPEVVKMGPIIMIYYIGTGLFLGIITLMDEGLELALGFHAANNLIGALLITSDWSAFQTHSILKDISEPSAGVDIIVPVLIIYPILLLIFSQKYQWTNWKEKLTGKILKF